MCGARQTTSKRFTREDFFESSHLLPLDSWIYLVGESGRPFVRAHSHSVPCCSSGSDLLPFFVPSKPGFHSRDRTDGRMVFAHIVSRSGRAVLPGCPADYLASLTA